MEDMAEAKKPLTADKIKKLRNLKYFRDWTEEEIIKWYELRHGNEAPPASPEDLVASDVAEVDSKIPETHQTSSTSVDLEEYKKKYNSYLNKYRKEYGVDMNETNDVEALKAFVRYTLQLERADEIIMMEQSLKSPDHRTLKGLGDFQRSLQMNLNELQDKLGITRKQRKEKTHDDIPQYIKSIQEKAKDFWQRKTVAVRCEACQITLAQYWLNFPDTTKKVTFTIICEKCGTEVGYVV